MTIQEINIGVSPNDNTGDDPRTVGQKLNSNFTTTSHAASRDVGTSTGEIPLSEDLNMNNGETNFTSGNIQPEIFDGELTKSLMRNTSGGAHGNNATCPGSQLELCRFTAAGAIQQISGNPVGSWKNVNNGQIAANEYGMYVRIV